MSTNPTKKPKFASTLLLLVLILFLATALRLHDLEVRSLWEDEGWTLVLSQGPTIPDIVQRMAFDQHPPLYFVAIHLWRDIAGSTEFALRMLSVLTGVVGVATIYQLGRAMFNRTAGIMAALFLALSDHHIDLSQDVRHYAQLATFVILSSWYYFRLIQSSQPSRGTRIGYVFTSIILLYSHYLGGFVLVCQATHMLLLVRPFKRLWWTGFHFGAVCLGFLPWLPIVIRQNQIRWETPLYYLNSLPNTHATYIMVRDALLGKQFGITLVLIGLGLVWLTYEQVHVRLKFRPLNPTLFLVMWGVGFTGLSFYLNAEKQFLTIRNFVLVTPAIALVVGHGLANLQLRVRLFMTTVLVVVALTTVDTRQLKPPWREVVHTITDYHSTDEPILMDIWVGDFPGRYYIEQQMVEDTPWLSIRETADEYKEQFLPAILTYIRDRDAFWVIYWKNIPIEAQDYAGIFADEGFQQTAAFHVDHSGNLINAYRYDRLDATSVADFSDDGEKIVSLKRFSITGEFEAGKTFTTRFLWVADKPPSVDYSISMILLDEGGNRVDNQDWQPQNGNAPMSGWESGALIFDQHSLKLPDHLAVGTYQLAVKVYYYVSPDKPLQTICTPNSENVLCDWVVVETFTIN
jgi:hypothetical protein